MWSGSYRIAEIPRAIVSLRILSKEITALRSAGESVLTRGQDLLPAVQDPQQDARGWEKKLNPRAERSAGHKEYADLSLPPLRWNSTQRDIKFIGENQLYEQ